MSPAIPREPIHPSLLPTPLVWEPYEGEFDADLLRLAPSCRFEQPAGGKGPPLHLRLIDPASARPVFFVRLRSGRTEAAFCAEVARELSAAGIPTPMVVETLKADIGCHVVYAWMNGCYPLSEGIDFEKLGKAVAAFHEAVRPLACKWPLEQDTATRLKRFRQLVSREQVADIKAWLGEETVRQQISVFPELCERMLADAAPTHGDLNPSNILQTPDGFAFLDFEDMRHMHVWPGFDIAKLIERLILTRERRLGMDWAVRAVGSLMSGYHETARTTQALEPAALVDAMRWHVVLSHLTVWQMPNRDAPAMLAEKKKLLGLSELIETRGAAICQAIE